jgi:hypothetical protein
MPFTVAATDPVPEAVTSPVKAVIALEEQADPVPTNTPEELN